MEKTPIEMIRILPADKFADAEKFIKLGEQLNCKSKVRFAVAHKTWKCVFSKRKPSRVLFTVDVPMRSGKLKRCSPILKSIRMRLIIAPII